MNIRHLIVATIFLFGTSHMDAVKDVRSKKAARERRAYDRAKAKKMLIKKNGQNEKQNLKNALALGAVANPTIQKSLQTKW